MKSIFNKKSIVVLINSVFSCGFLAVAAPTLFFSTFIASDVQAQNILEKKVTQVPITLNVSFKENPYVFILGDNKLCIDFYNLDGKNIIAPIVNPNDPLITKVKTILVSDRVRLVFEINQPVKYKLVPKGNQYILELIENEKFENLNPQPIPIFNGPQIVSPKFISNTPNPPEEVKNLGLTQEEKQKIIDRVNASINKNKKINVESIPPNIPVISVNNLEVQHVNIKKTEDKTSKLTIDFNDGAFTPNIMKEGNNLIIDLKGVSVPLELQKNIDTKILGTLLQSVDIATQKGNARLVLNVKDGWEYSVYQMDKKLVIEVKNLKEKPIDKSYKGKPLSLNFQNMDIRAIMQVIADFTGLNIMSSDAIQGSMSIRLKDVPWDQALDLVLEAKNLQKVQEGNVIWVATRQEITEKNKSELELLGQKSELSALKLEFFQLNHYKASELKDVIEGKSGGSSTNKPLGLISKRGSVGLDIRNNTIFVQDNEDSLIEIRKIIKRLDIPTRQVLIEAKLVIATDNFGRDLGAKFGIGLNKSKGNNGIGIGNSLRDSQSYANGSPVTPSGSTGFNLPVSGGGALGFTILNSAMGNYLSFELSALEKNNLGKVISSPRLLTSDNKKAVIKQGTQIPYTIPGTGTSAPTVNFKDALLMLGVTPQVSPNGRIMLSLEISKDNIGQMISLPGGGQVPSIDTRSINTEVTVSDGQTVVLGGVYEITSSNDLSKVPFFGDIPFLGNLFKNTSKTNQKAELLIFITPHVVNDEDLDAINNDQIKAPTEINLLKN